MAYNKEIQYAQRPLAVVTSASCDNCNRDISINNCYNGEDALPITLSGGYGMYYDDINLYFLFCKECADKLLETFPVMERELVALYGGDVGKQTSLEKEEL